MDPVSLFAAAGAVMAAIQLSNNVLQVLKGASQTRDPRVQVIRYNLMTQRALTIAWANRLRSENDEIWHIPPQSARDVEQILSEMQDYFYRAETKMEKIYSAPDGKMTSRVFLQRFLFINGGYEELRSITDALESMNKALLAIAPPPSAYSGVSLPDRSTSSAFRREVSEKLPELSGGQTNVPDTAKTMTPEVSIEALYSLLLKALASICAGSQQDLTLEYQYDRLKLWGAGILKTGRSSLDQVLKADSEGHRTFQEVLVRTLVYLAISEEIILKSLCVRVGAVQRQLLVRQRREILATLARDPLSQIAFERWSVIFADEHSSNSSLSTRSIDTEVETGESRKDGRLENQLHSHLPAGAPRTPAMVDLEAIEKETRDIQSASEEDYDQDEVTRLGSLIETLFDLLPGIRRIRRYYFRQLECGQLEKTTQPVVEQSSTTPPTDDRPATSELDPSSPLGLTFDQLLEHSLDLASSLETLLRNDETWARKNKQNVTIYSGILRKEVNRLQQFKKLSSEKSDSARRQEVIGTIATLGKALNEAIKDIAAPEKLGSWQKTGSGILMIDAKSATVDADEKIREVIEKFAAMNTDMWKMRQSAMVRA